MAFDPLSDPPETLFLSLPASDVCNLRCRHCHIWMQSPREGLLAHDRRLELVQEFAAWNPTGTVVLPGGEVTLELETLLSVAGRCKAAGLPLIVLTNGSRIDSSDVAEALALSGATHVVVSLDSARKELHDYVRGVPGAFEQALRAIALLVEAHRRVAPRLSVTVASVLFKENLDEFPEIVALCRRLGVHHVDCQLLARTFANRRRDRDVFFERHFWHEAAEKQRAKVQLRELFGRPDGDPIVVKSAADLPWMLAYVDDPDFETRSPVCGSQEKNLLVDATGEVSLCFNAAAILETPAIGNVRASSLREIWSSRPAAAARRVMDGCRLNCGALNCHRKRPVAESELLAFDGRGA
jgi:MoaA/NifB/PqqE/SkfB family radical SAM enzyme